RLVAWRIDGDGLVVHRAGATDAEGAFTIGPLPPGQYEVRIEAQPPPREPPCGLLTAAGDAVLPDLVVPAARR
ncbi:MAG TPA: carboxypeptidase-like regulatory domain-containing protein, partial [Planctomycetota bacterium]